jgi:hypothetical protein
MWQQKSFFTISLLVLILAGACNKHDDLVPDQTSNTIFIDSIIPSKRNLVVWEECIVTVYARGTNLSYKWEADHGSMLGTGLTTATYWACPSCLGTNTIKCTVTDENGSVSDTLMLHINGK